MGPFCNPSVACCSDTGSKELIQQKNRHKGWIQGKDYVLQCNCAAPEEYDSIPQAAASQQDAFHTFPKIPNPSVIDSEAGLPAYT